MKKIKLTQNKIAFIDDEDFERVSQFKWCAFKSYGGKFYAQRRIARNKVLALHRFIMNAQDSDLEVDHIDGNPLNNQKTNLRLVTHSQNQKNFKKFKNNTSGFKGVCWHKQKGKWRASIHCDGKQYFLGLFTSKVEAAHAYDIAAKRLFGEFSNLNFKKEEL